MSAVVKRLQTTPMSPIAPAVVTAVSPDGTIRVKCSDRRTLDAQLALGNGIVPHEGDSVLIATDANDEHYVIGLMGSIATVRTTDGSHATVAVEAGSEVLSVRDANGSLLFEHRPSEGRSVIHAPLGNLCFSAEHGSIEFAARDRVVVHSDRELELDAGHKIQLKTPHFEAQAKRADVTAQDASIVARNISTTAEKARTVVGVLETHATRILERAQNVYRDVEELAQTRAGRMRLAVKETFSLLGKRTLIRAEKDTRIDGEKIYLG